MNDIAIKPPYSPRCYQKKPVAIMALQYDGSAASIKAVLSWVNARGPGEADMPILIPGRYAQHSPRAGLLIHTLEGRMKVNPGDWIIRGVEGDFYPCKDSIFERKYESYGANQVTSGYRP